jgi:hypothetical protein
MVIAGVFHDVLTNYVPQTTTSAGLYHIRAGDGLERRRGRGRATGQRRPGLQPEQRDPPQYPGLPG